MTNHSESRTDRLVDAASQRLDRRPWPAQPIRSDLEVSFEFFPPKSENAGHALADTIRSLERFDPTFVSVTYGAGGTTQTRTLSTIATLQTSTDLSVAGHLTCVGKSAHEVQEVIDAYASGGVRRIVALRGDAPEGQSNGAVDGGYESAADLVAAIRARPDGDQFDISVAGYPEVHPKAQSAAADIESLKRKVDAGADRILTQFFFDTRAFEEFFVRARAARIDVPIIPGIMPVTNLANVERFAASCGTKIPEWMPELLGDLDEEPEVQQLIAATVAAEQCRRLEEFGIRQFHFYTMNRPTLTAATCRILGIRPKANAAREDAEPSLAVG